LRNSLNIDTSINNDIHGNMKRVVPLRKEGKSETINSSANTNEFSASNQDSSVLIQPWS